MRYFLIASILWPLLGQAADPATAAAPMKAVLVTGAIRKQLEQLAQLNEDHPYSYSRDALVKMLDEALAGTRPKK